MKRVFLIVLDSFGIGEMPDSADYNDAGANTLRSVSTSELFLIENLKKLGLCNIEGVDFLEKEKDPLGAFCRLRELSRGKDTTIGHWEIAGIVSDTPLPTYPNGFPASIIKEFSKRTGRGVICNRPYSGTEVIRDYGDRHVKTGDLIVYTSADSVFQIAAHEDVVPLSKLYDYCETARELLVGEHGVGRVIARPFAGETNAYYRTANRHDYSLVPPADTMLDCLKRKGLDTISVGKIYDIFAGKGIGEYVYTKNNADGMAKALEYAKKEFSGLCFINLVDFDMLYGHRNDIDGYAGAISEFDSWLSKFIPELKKDDLLIITADHGCDPGYIESTDHTREYVPMIIYGNCIKSVDLGTRNGLCTVGKTVCDYFEADAKISGESVFSEVVK